MSDRDTNSLLGASVTSAPISPSTAFPSSINAQLQARIDARLREPVTVANWTGSYTRSLPDSPTTRTTCAPTEVPALKNEWDRPESVSYFDPKEQPNAELVSLPPRPPQSEQWGAS